MTDGERGYECVLKLGGAIVGIARSVDPTLNAAEMDVTTRSNNGWKARKTGLKELTFSSELLWVPTNSALQAIETAFLANAEVTFEILDNSGYGWTGTCVLTQFKPGPQDLENAVMCTIEGASTGTVSKATGSS